MLPSPWKCWYCSAFTAHEDKTQKMHFCPMKNRPRFCCSCQGLPTALCLFSTTARLKMFLSIISPAFLSLKTPLRNLSVQKTCRWYKTHCNMTAPLLAVLQHPKSLCSCWGDECKRALTLFLAPHTEKSNRISPVFYFCVCTLCIYKKMQTNLEMYFINTALIGCFPFYQQDRQKQLFRQPTLGSWDDAFGWREPFTCTIQHGTLGSSPTQSLLHPLGAAPFLVGTWGRKMMRRNPVGSSTPWHVVGRTAWELAAVGGWWDVLVNVVTSLLLSGEHREWWSCPFVEVLGNLQMKTYT